MNHFHEINNSITQIFNWLNAEIDVKVFRAAEIDEHPNGDKLQIVKIDERRRTIIEKKFYKIGDLVVFIPAGFFVPNNELYSFLPQREKPKNKKTRKLIKVKRIREIDSHGIFMPAPQNTKVDDDVTGVMDLNFQYFIKELQKKRIRTSFENMIHSYLSEANFTQNYLIVK